MKDIYLFATQDKETKVGTEVVISFLQGKYANSQFTNVELVKEYQAIDVDYIWLYNNKKYLLEIKVDSYKTHNLFYEYYSNYELKTMGCMEKTECDFLAYYFSEKDILYILDPKKLKRYVNRYKQWLKESTVKNTTYHSLGYLVPIADLGSDIIRAKFENISKKA